jgi:hypothetical protein
VPTTTKKATTIATKSSRFFIPDERTRFPVAFTRPSSGRVVRASSREAA